MLKLSRRVGFLRARERRSIAHVRRAAVRTQLLQPDTNHFPMIRASYGAGSAVAAPSCASSKLFIRCAYFISPTDLFIHICPLPAILILESSPRHQLIKRLNNHPCDRV